MKREGAIVATGITEITGSLEPQKALVLRLLLGEIASSFVLRVGNEKEDSVSLTLTARDGRKSPWKKDLVQDALVKVRLGPLRARPIFLQKYWIRPNPHFYVKDDRKRLLENWEKLTPATKAKLTVRVEHRDDEVWFWLDDRFIGRTQPDRHQLELTLQKSNPLLGCSFEPLPRDRQFLPLLLAGYRRGGIATGMRLSLMLRRLGIR